MNTNTSPRVVSSSSAKLDWPKYYVGEHEIYFRGWFKPRQNQLLKGERAARELLFLFLRAKGEFANNLALLDGNFVFIITSNSDVIAGVDRIRSCPLFYKVTRENIQFSLCAEALKNSSSPLNQEAMHQLLLSGYTFGNNTIYDQVYQLTAGQHLSFQNGFLDIIQYTSFLPTGGFKKYISSAAATKDLETLFEKYFADLVQDLFTQPVVVPISAGLDSRLILTGLREQGHPNIHAYSYGIKGNADAETGRLICKELDIPWLFIEMKPKTIRQFSKSEQFSKFYDFCQRGDSVPFLQDFFAVTQLKEQKLVPSNSCFINGNSGDFISGGHIPEVLYSKASNPKENVSAIRDALIRKHYSLWEGSPIYDIKQTITQRIEYEVTDAVNSFGEILDLSNIYEYFELRERQSKFVISGQRVYDFLGFDWRLPLWEKPIIDFFLHLEPKYKFNQKLYAETLVRQNWGNVWKNIPVNEKYIEPKWIIPIRTLCKAACAVFGKPAWRKIDRMFFEYWTDTLCSYSYMSFKETLSSVGRNRNAVAIRSKTLIKDINKRYKND